MLPGAAAACLGDMPAKRRGALAAGLQLSVLVRVVRAMRESDGERLLAEMPAKIAGAVRARLDYGAHTVGAAMDPWTTALPENISVGEALKRIANTAHKDAGVYLVVDADLRLRGAVTPAQLLRSNEDVALGSLALAEMPSVPVRAAISGLVDHPVWDSHRVVPVVERDGAVVGALHFRDVGRAATERNDAHLGLDVAGTLGALELGWLSLARLVDIVLAPQRRNGDTRPGDHRD
jgi:Mg/Co/Ni transporter MgtE